ncbi:hypothetical protein ACHAXR_009090 [Thalassiosira sp. AJA248-18]
MSSPLFNKKSFNGVDDAEEKKNDGVVAPNNNNNATADPMMLLTSSADATNISNSSSFEIMQETDDNAFSAAEEEEEDGAGGGSPRETMSIVSDAAIVMNGAGDEPLVNNAPNSSSSRIMDSSDTTLLFNNNTTSCPKWSDVLSTPSSDSPLFTPASDMSSLKQNLHGLGLKYSVDRAKVLSRTGKNCSTLLTEIASLHDELSNAMNKLCPMTLEQAAHGTPMEQFAGDVNRCIGSFTEQIGGFGLCIQNDIARPYHDSSVNLVEEGGRYYSQYSASRVKCAQSRKEALKLRKKYVESTKDLDGAIATLRKARRASSRALRKRKNTESSNEINRSNSKDEGIEVSTWGVTTTAALTWEEELRQFGDKFGLVKQCESIIRASEEMQSLQTKYSASVAEENAAVDDSQDMERMALDSGQRLEEERIVFLIGLLDRFLQDEKESLENMSLDLTSVEPLDMADGKHRELPVPSTPSSSAAPSLFMSPRRRAQSDDGPAINETRMLNLPDNIAGIRDNMKSLIGRLLGRLKTLKLVAAFNEGMASAIDSFASNLKSQLESKGLVLNKNEGANVLDAWNSAIASLEMYATCAEILARQIRKGNNEMQLILVSTERESKTFQEKEEFRWKSLCEAARVETKAKLKHKQCVADLEKARARLTLVEGEGGGVSSSEGGVDDSNGGGNVSPLKQRAQTTKIDRHMNKAMGKMFSILPGGGEDVMNKVLTPQQRQAISQRQLDEAKAKEEKGTESFEIARSVKQQAVVSYETEAEVSEFKFKSEERREWNEMQKSLVCSVDAMKNFREGHLKSVLTSIDAVKGHLQGNALDDVARWTSSTEKRVRDQRARSVDDTKDEESPFECGFALKVQLVERTDVKELIRCFLDDKDIAVDDVDVSGGEDVESPPKEAKPSKEVNGDVINETPTPLPDVPPDVHIGKMDSIFSKKLKNVTIDNYYIAGWSEEIPLYLPWLERKGSFDVSVSDWEQSSDGGFEHIWSGEKYQQKRTIRFKFRRTTHLYIGPPIAGVTQTQYLIKDGNDRCVVMMTVEMDGIPYSDTFAVEVRWVARRVKENDIAVDAGVFVRFTKSSIGTLKETSPIHLDLFEEIKSAIASGEEGEGIVDLEVEDEPDEVEVVVKEEKEAAAPIEIVSQFEGIFRQFVAVFLSLTQNQQLLLALVVLYFVTKILFHETELRAETVDNLSQKVDDLTNEVREMKAMLESIAKMIDQSNQESDEL